MYQLNQIIKTKKTHACGANEWTVVRTGADYKIKCNNCGRVLLVDSSKLDKMVKNKQTKQ